MRYCNRSQTDQDEVLDDACHVTSALMAAAPKVILLYAKHKIKKLKNKVWQLKW